jgi:hypothetical protein
MSSRSRLKAGTRGATEGQRPPSGADGRWPGGAARLVPGRVPLSEEAIAASARHSRRAPDLIRGLCRARASVLEVPARGRDAGRNRGTAPVRGWALLRLWSLLYLTATSSFHPRADVDKAPVLGGGRALAQRRCAPRSEPGAFVGGGDGSRSPIVPPRPGPDPGPLPPSCHCLRGPGSRPGREARTRRPLRASLRAENARHRSPQPRPMSFSPP